MQRSDDPRELVPLFDAVAARPDDDPPRQVLADALLERGDARGEFIQLQLLRARGLATTAQQEREKHLLAHHWRKWLSEVPGIGAKASLDFQRGFLRACALQPCGVGVDSPTWRMIERLEVVNPQTPTELAAPALTRLESLVGLDAASLAVVLAGPDKPRLRELGFAGPHMLADRARREQAQIAALTRFPSLRVLSLAPTPFRHHADWHEWLFASPVLPQLERVRLWMELPFDVMGLHALLVRRGLPRLKLELATMGVKLHLDLAWLTVQFDSEFWLGRHGQAMRNLAPNFAPFPYRRFDVRVGDRPATPAELERLGDVFRSHGA